MKWFNDFLWFVVGVLLCFVMLITAPFWLFLWVFNHLNNDDDNSNYP